MGLLPVGARWNIADPCSPLTRYETKTKTPKSSCLFCFLNVELERKGRLRGADIHSHVSFVKLEEQQIQYSTGRSNVTRIWSRQKRISAYCVCTQEIFLCQNEVHVLVVGCRRRESNDAEERTDADPDTQFIYCTPSESIGRSSVTPPKFPSPIPPPLCTR